VRDWLFTVTIIGRRGDEIRVTINGDEYG